jgi:catechol 2,3-dioxygenase-like lactoylglutathione lyase family enzyme
MFKGINHVGIGVTDMERSLKFYGEELGFKKRVFDYTGVVPGIESLIDESGVKVRMVLLQNENIDPIGHGMIKLVQILPPHKPSSIASDSLMWGELYVAEACLRACNVDEVFGNLVEKGYKPILTPAQGGLPPYYAQSKYVYIADPDGGAIELLEGGICKDLDGKTKVKGLNHVGFGVVDIEESIEYYNGLGFNDFTFDYKGLLTSMATMFPEPIKMRIVMRTNFQGAWVELIQYIEPHKPRGPVGKWGMIGPMEYAVGVSNIEKAYKELQKKNYEFICLPQILEVDSGEFRYAYLKEPNGHYLSIVEVRC